LLAKNSPKPPAAAAQATSTKIKSGIKLNIHENCDIRIPYMEEFSE
jgi:hypothetical protein